MIEYGTIRLTKFLFAGCQTNTAKETASSAVEEKISNNEVIVIENDIKEERQDKDIKKAPTENMNIYNDVLTQYSDMVQHDFYANTGLTELM